jgi:CDP-glycerol glycerophosphotransferase
MQPARRLETVARKAFQRLTPNLQGHARKVRDALRHRVDEYRNARELLSVVMPVHNVESYLAEAVRSVLCQQNVKLELILVDDGSTDTSGEMCDEFTREDARVRVIHKSNAGLGAARNTGIAAARGKYLTFIDSDDYLLPGAYEAMIKALRGSGSDVVTGNVQRRQGNRIFQVWNQSRSHRVDRYGIKLPDLPDLMFDTLAWNKMYRAKFWRAQVKAFPVDKLYEDMLPVFTALHRARSIDVLSRHVYVWRLRDEGNSITQRLHEPRNIGDRFEMIDTIRAMIASSGLEDPLGARLTDKILEGDLWLYIREMRGAGPEMIKIYESAAKRYWRPAPESSKSFVVPERRICYWLLEHDRGDEVEEFRLWYDSLASAPPMRRDGGDLFLDVTACPVPLDGVPPVYLDMAKVAVGVSTVTKLAWTAPGELTIAGYAYTRFVSDGDQEITLTATDTRTGDSLTFPVHRMYSSEAALSASDTAVAHDNDGYSCTIDAAALMRSSPLEKGRSEWAFEVRVADGDVVRAMPMESILRSGSGAMIGTSVLADDTRASVRTDSRRPLRIVFDVNGTVASAFTVSGAAVRVGFDRAGAAAAAERVWLTGPDGTQVVEAERSGVEAFAARLPVDPAVAKTVWQVRARVSGRDLPVVVPRGFRPDARSDPSGMSAVADRWGRAVVHAYTRTAAVDEVGCPSDTELEVSGALLALDEVEIGVAPVDGLPTSWHRAERANGRFHARIPLHAADFGGVSRPLPSGGYLLHARGPGSGAADIVLTDAAALDLPAEHLLQTVKVRISRAAASRVAVDLSAPVADEMLGPYAQQRLVDAYSGSDRQLEESVFFCVDLGSNACDSALTIHQELRRRGSPLRCYWGVVDLSVPVPAGGVAVVKQSPEWFAKLNTSRYIVNNYGDIRGLVKHPDQRYLQTWHGTPYKYIGLSEERHRNASRTRIEQIGRESADWDAFISPNPYMSALIPTEFGYRGAVLETGYPRNDRLASAGAPERAAVRDALGLPGDAKVLLYAPTFREGQRHGWTAAIFDGLDLARLQGLLGADWWILLRGHSFNARDDHADRSADRMLDVTRHPDINDLYLAADVLVTDYSSAMFDFAVTGRPMAFFTPDLKQYVATRGVYFDLAETAPGPMYEDVVHLADGLRDPDALAARYRERYDLFCKRFTPWDDGKAAARVVDSFFA